MRQITNLGEIYRYVLEVQNSGKSIGFVPTMGALHRGHLSLVEQSAKENSVTIVSIFVNPTQFNSKEDLEKYPRMVDSDLKLLESVDCDIVFTPIVQEIYSPEFVARKVDLGFLAKTMEGFYRPGHFDGVVEIVQRLFDIVQPTRAYFGRKDFQQVAVIRKMTSDLNYSVEIIEGETIREMSGLAMSSRNLRLTETEKDEATLLFSVLNTMRKNAANSTPFEQKNWGEARIKESNLTLEYLEIVHPDSLEPLTENWVEGATACVVAYCNSVRLIDNMELIPRS